MIAKVIFGYKNKIVDINIEHIKFEAKTNINTINIAFDEINDK